MAPARDAMVAGCVAVDVVRQAPLVGHELLPRKVAGKGRWQTDLPRTNGNLGRGGARLGSPPNRIRPPATVDVGAGIGGVLQDGADPCAVRLAPSHLVRRRAEQWANRQRQVVRAQVAHHGARALQLGELGEDQPQPFLQLLVGVEDDAATTLPAEPGRQWQAQLAARRLLALALVQPQLDLVQLGLAHDPGQAQQKPVVVGARVVETLAVGEDHAEQRAQLEQLMPVAVVAGQP